MVKNLAHTPLTAIIFAAIWCFTTPFLPVLPMSEGYSEVLSGFTMPYLGYAYITVYGLWLSLILALIYSSARGKGIILTLIAAAILLFTQWVFPNIWTYIFGETTGVMTRMDLIFSIVQGIIAMIFLMVLAFLLFKPVHKPEPPAPPVRPNAPPPPPPPPDKYKIKVRRFAITMVVLPVIYMVMFFLIWYFLLLRSNDARAFYSVSEETNTFAKYLINMILTDSKQMLIALINGVITVLPLILLMFQFAHKRVMFIIISVMLLLGPAVRMLIPSAVMPDAVRFALLLEMAAVAVLYGALSAFMIHMCIFKVQPPAPAHLAVPAPAKGKKPEGAEESAEATPEADAKKAKK